MLLIQQVTSDPLQEQTLILPDGTQLGLTIYFRPLQQGWFINELSYEPSSFLVRGVRICNSPNILYQWKNLLPFGLACYTAGNREPSQQDDFVSGASKLYILSSDEVKEYARLLKGG